MFTFKVYYTDGATEVFPVQHYQTRPTELASSLEININDTERFLYISLAPPIHSSGIHSAGIPAAPDCAQIDRIYVVNENGKTVDTLGRKG